MALRHQFSLVLLERTPSAPIGLSACCRLAAEERTLLGLRGLRVSGEYRSALWVRHSRFAVRRLSGFPTSPHYRGALQPLSRGRHRPTTELLLQARAPLQGFTESQPPARTSARLRGIPVRLSIRNPP
jgi:hypothetical protein